MPICVCLDQYGGWLVVFYGPFNSISVISSQWKGDNERLCATELCLPFKKICLQWESNPLAQQSSVSLLKYCGVHAKLRLAAPSSLFPE